MNAVRGNKKIFGNQFLKGAQKSTPVANAPNPGLKSNALGNFVFLNFCQPARVYLILAFLTLLYFVSIEQSLIWLIIKAIIFIVWAFMLNKMCTSGNKAIAWLLAIVPQCIFLLLTVKSSSSSSTAPAPIALPTN